VSKIKIFRIEVSYIGMIVIPILIKIEKMELFGNLPADTQISDNRTAHFIVQ
jgi:hypothetical protein